MNPLNMDPDLGLEADALLGFVGIGIFAYGMGAGHYGLAAAGAGLAGWFGGLAVARLGGLAAVVNSLKGDPLDATSSTNGSGQGTP